MKFWWFVVVLGVTGVAQGELKYEEPRTYRLKMVLRVEATGTVRNVQAVGPRPIDWPEQKVKLISEKVTPGATCKETTLVGQAGMVRLQAAQIAAGQMVEVERVYEITKYRIVFEGQPNEWVVPKAMSRDIRDCLLESPGVEMKHPTLIELAKPMRAESTLPWDTALQVQKWVKENVKYENGQFRGALFAVQNKSGDCEEMSALFTALCRLQGIPARNVWVEGHDYPEFYLTDGKGRGAWIPLQLVGADWFGKMADYRPILQKGDKIQNPFTRRFERHVPQTLTGVGAVPKLIVENRILSEVDINSPDFSAVMP